MSFVKNSTFAEGVLIALFLVSPPARSQPPAQKSIDKTIRSSWPMFGGNTSRNMVNEIDRGLPDDWSVAEGKIKNIRWSTPIGSHFFGSPIIADGKVLVGTYGIPGFDNNVSLMVAYRESDGKRLWHNAYPFPDRLRGFWPYMSSPSNPTVDGDGVYYITPSCVLVRADLETGKIRWQYDMPRELKVHSSMGTFWSTPPHASPLVVGDRVFVTTNNGCYGIEGGADDGAKWQIVVSPEAPSFIALDKKTGKLLWKSNLPGKNIVDGSWASPVFANVGGVQQVIFAGGDGVVYSFVPESGELIWRCDCNVGRDVKSETVNSIVATPALVGDRLFVCLGRTAEHAVRPPSTHVLCLDVRKKGDVSLKSYDAAAADNKASALVWSFGGPIIPRPEKGRRVKIGNVLGTPAIKDGLLYIGEEVGYFHCLDAATGERLWTHDLKASIWGSPLWVDGRVYVGGEDRIHVLASGRKLKVLAEIDMGNIMTYATPAAANGVLFVATGNRLYAIGAPVRDK